MIIIKSIPQRYQYLFIIVFLLGVELIWLTPAIAINSTTQTSPQNTTKDETDKADTIAADVTEATTDTTETADPVVQTSQDTTKDKTDKADTIAADATEATTDTTETADPVVQTSQDTTKDETDKADTIAADVTDTTTDTTETADPVVQTSQDTTEDETGETDEINETGEIDETDETDETDTIAADITDTKTTDKADTNNSLFDSGAPPKTNISLTPDLYFGARFELEFQTEKDFDFDTENAEDISTLESILSLAFLYTPTRNFSAFLNIDPSQALVVDQRDRKKDKTRLEVIQAYLSFKKVIGDLDIRVGRQRFKDKREWLYDEELDGIRFLYNFPKASVEFSASEKKHKDLINGGDDEKIMNYVLYGKYALNKKTNIAAYVFARDDNTTTQEKPIFYGLQLNGKHSFKKNKITNKLNYWLELAHVEDENGANRISASGFDIGTTYRFGHPLKPAVTFAYAYGSGDADPSDNIDKNFRQTGLQDNDAKFNGIVRMKYYGEMFDPELSNLIVQTVGFGIWPTKRMSVDLVYHNYRQDELSDNIRDSEIDLDPSGLSKKLGQEFDLVVGFRGEERRSKVSFILGHFVPGSAFPTANSARFVEIKYKRKF